MSYTYVTLTVSRATFDEVEAKLRAAGYHHVFDDGGKTIDMHGLALVAEPVQSSPEGLFDAMEGGGASHA